MDETITFDGLRQLVLTVHTCAFTYGTSHQNLGTARGIQKGVYGGGEGTQECVAFGPRAPCPRSRGSPRPRRSSWAPGPGTAPPVFARVFREDIT